MDLLIIQPNIRSFRTPFYIALHQVLKSRGDSLRVLYSEPFGDDAARGDSAELPDTFGKKVARLRIGRLVYQPAIQEILKADIVIIQQEVKLFWYHALLFLSTLKLKRVALWGLGYSPYSILPKVSKLLRNATVRLADHWFAYTQLSSDFLLKNGVPPEKITLVQNSTDTNAFRRDLALVEDADLSEFRRIHGIQERDFNLLFCGGLYFDKRIPALLEVGARARQELGDVNLLIAGTGPDRGLVEREAARNPWIKYLGLTFGRKKAVLFKSASLYVCPGLVGLNIVDAFAAGLPFVSEKSAPHSPEIAYLKSGENGYLASGLDDMVSFISACRRDPALWKMLSSGATRAGTELTIEQMVKNFVSGVDHMAVRSGRSLTGSSEGASSRPLQ